MVLKVVIMKTRGNLGSKRSLYTMVREEKEQEHMSIGLVAGTRLLRFLFFASFFTY